MSNQADFLQMVAELYWLMGHKITRIVQRSETTTDLVIKSNKGESWYVRCKYEDEVEGPAIDHFVRLVGEEKVRQAALIVAGKIKPDITQIIASEGLNLVDGKQLYDYLIQARLLNKRKTNPIRFALQEILWRVRSHFVERTYRPFPRLQTMPSTPSVSHTAPSIPRTESNAITRPLRPRQPSPNPKWPTNREIYTRASTTQQAAPKTQSSPSVDKPTPWQGREYVMDENGILHFSEEKYRELYDE